MTENMKRNLHNEHQAHYPRNNQVPRYDPIQENSNSNVKNT